MICLTTLLTKLNLPNKFTVYYLYISKIILITLKVAPKATKIHEIRYGT